MLPSALCLQSLQFMHVSQQGSAKRSFVPPKVQEWLWRHFQHTRDVERRIVKFSSRARETLLGVLMSLAVSSCNLFVFEGRQYPVLLRRLVPPHQFLSLPDEQFFGTTCIQRRFKPRHPAEPPGVGYDLLCQPTFERALGI